MPLLTIARGWFSSNYSTVTCSVTTVTFRVRIIMFGRER